MIIKFFLSFKWTFIFIKIFFLTIFICQSLQCRVDYVSIQTSTASAYRYCGNRTFSVISEGHQIITELHSSLRSRGGQFLCTLRTVVTEEHCRCGWKNPVSLSII